MKSLLTTCIVLLFAATLVAEDRVATIFQDNMVLQREMPVPVWGWAAPGSTVDVTFAGQKKQGTADAKGYWKVLLDPMPANRVAQTLEVHAGATTIARKNILVGEVWVAAGQSNMVVGGPDKDTGVYPHHVSPGTAGGKPEIRVAPFGWGASLEPVDDIEPVFRDSKSWDVMKEPVTDTVGPANYSARVVRDSLDVPVGIVRVAVPGTNQAAWMSRATLESFPGNGKGNFYEEFFADTESKLAKSGGPIKSWADFTAAETAWREKREGRAPSTSLTFLSYPTVLYNTRIHPLAPFAIRGVIWHQGEAGPGGPYGERLVAMVKQWRTLFGQDFYFVWGTLGRSTVTGPPLTPLRSGFYRSSNNEGIRKALEVFGGDKRVALVDLYDLGNEDTHFLQKAEMGRRFGLAALSVAYGQPQVYSGPRMAETKIDGGRAVIRFDLVGDGLVYTPSIDGISGFYVRGKTGPAQWGVVKVIDKNTLEVSHPDIAELATVAYGANQNPHETLFNSAGLPASPFTVNPTNARDDPAPFQLLTMPENKEVIVQLSHVRREGYVFQLKPSDAKVKPGPVTLQAYIPAEWEGFEVESGGKPVATTPADKDGKHFVSFQANVDGAWIIVAAKGKAADFRKVNRY